MLNIYELSMRCRCPNGRNYDLYDVRVEATRMIECEKLIDMTRGYGDDQTMYQEDVAKSLAKKIGGCTVTLIGNHHGVKVTCIADSHDEDPS